MTLTPTNYTDLSCQIDFSALPQTFTKGHDLALNAFKDQQAAYKANTTVKAVMDHYLKELNAVLSKQKKPRKASIKPKSKLLKPIIGQVPKISEEVSFIRRFLWLDGKVRSKKSIETLLFSLQKAIIERRIRKASPYAAEIRDIQSSLYELALLNVEEIEISINPKRKQHYSDIARSQQINEAVRLLKQYIPLQGKDSVEDKARRLQVKVKTFIENPAFKKNTPFYASIQKINEELSLYLENPDKVDMVVAPTTQELGKLPEVLSSQQLLAMEFETIGLKGKWKELIGNPSIGFSMMVFGQPKSGKSTLMMEFAQYLAVHHGKTLYVAIEEGFGYTLKDKIQRVGANSSNLSFAANMPETLTGLDFVFIDSISRGGLEIEDLIKLQEEYPKIGFIYIFHTTKDGRFRGGNHYAHEVDVIVEVSPEEIKASGRFGPAITTIR